MLSEGSLRQTGSPVLETLRQAILVGDLLPGERLVEGDLAQRFGASRGAVREALTLLDNEGLVIRQANRGAWVRTVSVDETIEFTEVRAVLEGLCAAKAAQKATAGDREALRRVLAGMQAAVEAGDVLAYCAHRRAPLFYGRNEECGLRCVYHGWKYDTLGNCVDMPSEPPVSKLRFRVTIKAYPVYEAGGIVWTYLGPQQRMPEPPDYEWLRIPPTHVRVSKTGEQCNFLQAIEGGIDTVHSSFAHNNDLGNSKLLRSRDTHPRLEVDEHGAGFTYASLRNVNDDTTYLRVYQFLMPFQQSRGDLIDWEGNPAKLPGIHGHIWVPIDDEHTFVYNWMYAADERYPISDVHWAGHESWMGRGADDYVEGSYWLKLNPGNDFGIDREIQRTRTFTGIQGINTQDFAIQTGMTAIVDRSLEALGSTDRAIQTARKLLLEAADAVEAGRDPRGVAPETHSRLRGADLLVARGSDWRDASKEATVAVW